MKLSFACCSAINKRLTYSALTEVNLFSKNYNDSFLNILAIVSHSWLIVVPIDPHIFSSEC